MAGLNDHQRYVRLGAQCAAMPTVPCASETTGQPPSGGGVVGYVTMPVTARSSSFASREWYMIRFVIVVPVLLTS